MDSDTPYPRRHSIFGEEMTNAYHYGDLYLFPTAKRESKKFEALKGKEKLGALTDAEEYELKGLKNLYAAVAFHKALRAGSVVQIKFDKDIQYQIGEEMNLDNYLLNSVKMESENFKALRKKEKLGTLNSAEKLQLERIKKLHAQLAFSKDLKTELE